MLLFVNINVSLKELVTKVRAETIFFLNFIVTPSNTDYYVFMMLMGLHFVLKILASYLISELRWHTHKIRSPSLGKGHI